MSLTPTGLPAVRHPGHVEFDMFDQDRQLVCVMITDHALDDLEPETKQGSDYQGIFDRQLERIYAIAARKFCIGERAVTINAVDVQNIR
ncbi:MAG: hypothetical protein QOF41_840 [Methylobacteriaceae bacterium]|nr:hypothetical protein [Methylobacteriaceae bacterium]